MMICRTLPASATSLDACAHRPFPARLPHPANGLLLLNYQFIPNSLWGNQNSRFALPPQNQLSSRFAHRLSFSTAFLERLYCSLNLIEPHVGPDLRSMLSVDPGTAGYDPRNPYASSCCIGICGNPRCCSESSSRKEPAGRPTARYNP